MGDSTSMIVSLLLTLFLIVSIWIVLSKADQPGWSIFVPIYNLYCLLQAAGMSGWWIIALCIPGVNLIPLVLIPLGIAGHFRKGLLFGFGLLLLPFIFYPVLAFSDAEWS